MQTIIVSRADIENAAAHRGGEANVKRLTVRQRTKLAESRGQPIRLGLRQASRFGGSDERASLTKASRPIDCAGSDQRVRSRESYNQICSAPTAIFSDGLP